MGKNKKNKGQKNSEPVKTVPEVQKAELSQPPAVPPVSVVQPAETPVELAKPEELAKTDPPAEVKKSERFPNRKKKSTIQSPTKTVWSIADQVMAADPAAQRKDIMKACLDAGIAFYTARTQIQQWFAAQRESRLQAAKAANPMVKAS